MNKCRLCGQKQRVELLHFGDQPICHKFIKNNMQDDKHPLILGQCVSCGLVQLIDPAPVERLLPRYEWIRYNEPERHLDHTVDIISSLPGITKNSVICGLSDKDDSTLARFKQRGFNRTWRINMVDDLGITDPGAGIESIQDRLNSDQAFSLQQTYGEPDIIIARHIIEHTQNTLQFMASLSQLVKPSGYVVFEAPDYTKALETFNFATIWEEHTLYFTQETFRNCFGFGAFSLFYFNKYPYPYENSLVGITQPQENVTRAFPPKNTLEIEKHRAQSFSFELTNRQGLIKQHLSDYRHNQGKIAIFGTGHVACTFINLMGLKDLIEFVVDDDSNKIGCFMPGSRLPILSSDALIEEKISLCLLSVSSETEAKVIPKNKVFIEQGGTFASIFPSSKYALRV